MRHLMLASAFGALVYAVLAIAYGDTQVAKSMAATGIFSAVILLGIHAVLKRLDGQ